MNPKTLNIGQFNQHVVKHGVLKGQRHEVLTWYFHYLTQASLYFDGVVYVLLDWNRTNSPPMHPEEVAATIYDLWGNRPVKKPIIRDSNGNEITEDSYLIDTEAARALNKRLDLDLTPLVHCLATVIGCERWRDIRRKDTYYQSHPSPCHRLTCGICSNRMREELMNHLVKVTSGQDLYLITVKDKDWPRVFRAINKLKADFAKIRNWEDWQVVADKPLPAGVKIPSDKLRIVLGSLMSDVPDLYDRGPKVLLSSNWALPPKPIDTGTRWVVKTWLPVWRQKEVACKLGAEIRSLNEWHATQDVPPGEWEGKFVEAIHNEEKVIEENLSVLGKYLRSYVEDELYILDRYSKLFEGLYGQI